MFLPRFVPAVKSYFGLQLSSAEPAWKWDSQQSWPEAFFFLGSARRSALKGKRLGLGKRIYFHEAFPQQA